MCRRVLYAPVRCPLSFHLLARHEAALLTHVHYHHPNYHILLFRTRLLSLSVAFFPSAASSCRIMRGHHGHGKVVARATPPLPSPLPSSMRVPTSSSSPRVLKPLRFIRQILMRSCAPGLNVKTGSAVDQHRRLGLHHRRLPLRRLPLRRRLPH